MKHGKRMVVDFKANLSKTRNMEKADLTGLMEAIILAILRMECSMDLGSTTFRTSRRHIKDLLSTK